MELANIPEQIILQHLESYRQLAVAARSDETHKSDLQAALEAPAVFLTGADRFEVAFDAILHHLTEANKKAITDQDRHFIYRTAEEMIYIHAFAVQERIRFIRDESNRTIYNKAKDFVSKATQASLPASLRLAPVQTQLVSLGFSMAPDLLGLAATYLQKLALDSRLGQTENALYLQLGRVYRKYLRSNCYSGEFTLLSNFFETHRKDVVIATLEENIQAAIELSNLALDALGAKETLYICASNLAEKGDSTQLIEFLTLVNKYRPTHLQDVKKKVELGYEAFLKKRSKEHRNQVFALLGCGGCLVFALAPGLFLGLIGVSAVVAAFGANSATNNTSPEFVGTLSVALGVLLICAFFVIATIVLLRNQIRMMFFRARVERNLMA